MGARRTHAGIFRLAACVLAAALALGSARAQGAAAPAPARGTTVHRADPGSVVTLAFALTHESSRPLAGRPEVRLPAGWSEVIPAGEVRLEPGVSAVAMVTVRIPSHARAGRHPVALRLDAADATLESTVDVEVAERRSVELERLAAPSALVVAPFEIRARVVNAGNAPQRLELRAHGNAGFPVEVAPSALELAPGESAEATVRAEPPASLERPLDAVVTLRAEDPERPEVHAALTTKVALLANRQPARLAAHTLPLRVRLSGRTATGVAPGQDRETANAATIEVTGRGPLRDGGDTVLSVRLRNGTASGRRANTVELHHPDYRLALGDRSFSSAGFGARSGFGIDARAELPSFPLDASAGAHAFVDAGGAVGVGAELRVAPRPDLAFTVRAATPNGDAGARLAVGAEVAFDVHATATTLEAAVAADFGGAAAGGVATAHRLRADLREGEGRLSVRWESRQAGFGTHAAAGYSVDLEAATGIVPRYGAGIGVAAGRSAEAAPGSGVFGPPATLAQHVRVWFDRHLGATTARVTYAGRERTDAEGTSGEGSLRFAVTSRLHGGIYLQPSLELHDSHDTDGTDGTDGGKRELRLRLAGDAPLLGGRVTAATEFVHGFGGAPVGAPSLDLAWRGPVGADLRLGGRLGADLGAGDYEAEVDATHRLAGGTELHAAARARLAADRSARLELRGDLAIPVAIPLGRRSDVGAVRGRLVDEAGEGLPGIVVWLAGYTSVTDARGAFDFPAVPLGEQTLALHGPPPDRRVARPGLPLALRVEAGTPVEVVVELLPEAVVAGTVVRADSALDRQRFAGPRGGAVDCLRRAAVVLRQGERFVRAPVEPDGSFEARGLTPGAWRVHPTGAHLPRDCEATGVPEVVELRAGERAELRLELRPVARSIRIMDGGTLQTPP